jgi:hypothetical protein
MWLLLVFPLFQAGAAQDAPNLDDVIRNVQASEKLYRNVDVQWTTKYELVKEDSMENAYRKMTRTRRWVSQDNNFRGEWRETGSILTGEAVESFQLTTYDGTKTRTRNGGLVNLRDGRHCDTTFTYRPHTVLLEQGFVFFPLSTFLRGDESIMADLNATIAQKFCHRISVVGTETVDGNRCIVINVESVKKDAPSVKGRFLISLCIDKQFIPIRYQGFASYLSTTTPIDSCRVTKWREIEPGVFIPSEWSIETIDDYELRTTGKVVLSNRQTATVDSITLNPKLEEKFFSDFPLKEGDTLYDINAQGVIRKGGFLKANEKASGRIDLFSWSMYGLLAIALVALACGGYLYRRS